MLTEKSLEKLSSCHPDLIKVVKDASEYIPNLIVLYGFRTISEQFQIFKKGRVLSPKGIWIQNGITFTNFDGINKKSKHNYSPSLAVDLACLTPSGNINWNDLRSFDSLAKQIKISAKKFNIKIVWGGDWTKKDRPHFEL